MAALVPAGRRMPRGRRAPGRLHPPPGPHPSLGGPLNRQQRRAEERRGSQGQPQLAGFAPFLTYDEISILEEALARWLHETRQDLDELVDAGGELTSRHSWSLERGEKLRQAFSATLENRPWHDIGPKREAPRA